MTCWCGETHDWEDWDSPSPSRAMRALGHLIIAEMKIPQLAEWLQDRINRGGRG